MTVDICDDKCLGCSNGGAGLCRRYRHLVETEKKSMREIIEQLVSEELARANEKFPGFNSNHEAYAVLLEEVEELQHEVIQLAGKGMTEMWEITKRPRKGGTRAPKATLQTMRHITVKAIEEAIQVAAMCDKWIQFLERGEEKNDHQD